MFEFTTRTVMTPLSSKFNLQCNAHYHSVKSITLTFELTCGRWRRFSAHIVQYGGIYYSVFPALALNEKHSDRIFWAATVLPRQADIKYLAHGEAHEPGIGVRGAGLPRPVDRGLKDNLHLISSATTLHTW